MFVYAVFKDYDKALPLNELTAEGFEARYGPNHFNTLGALERLRLNYQVCGRPEQEERVLRELLARWRKVQGSDSKMVSIVLYNLGQSLVGRKLYADAEKALREARAIRDRVEPDGWEAFHVRSLLGAALAGQRKFAEAEPLLRSGYEGLEQREQTVPRPVRFRITEAVERLVELHEAWGKPDQAKTWRAKLDARKGRTPSKRNDP